MPLNITFNHVVKLDDNNSLFPPLNRTGSTTESEKNRNVILMDLKESQLLWKNEVFSKLTSYSKVAGPGM